tara:strand:- start:4159 stop:4803 length:645 start_codon:yes stop_codon:yes gene_type:complete
MAVTSKFIDGKCLCTMSDGTVIQQACDRANCPKCCQLKGNEYGKIAINNDTLINEDINPASDSGFGFNTSYDGRIRGGIKTPDWVNTDRPMQEFDIFDRPKATLTNDPNSNSMNSPLEKSERLVRIHPLDIAGSRRTIGQTVYDPISKNWKEDDGRPRGMFEDETGKIAWGCWGKCKVRKGIFPFKRTTVQCNCNKNAAKTGCVCAGCLGGSRC